MTRLECFCESWFWPCACFAPVKGEHRFPRGKEESIPAAPGKELHLRISLALVGFKAQGQFSVGFKQLRLGCSGQSSEMRPIGHSRLCCCDIALTAVMPTASLTVVI